MKSIGSGCKYALRIIQQGYKMDMTVKEAIALARRALTWAIIKDWRNQGVIYVFYLDKNGKVHKERFEGEMSSGIQAAAKARIALRKKFKNEEFDVDKLVLEVKYVAGN
ncbi:hypothetical protein K1719_008058 [Acacia pycnantha]|nr:hypothetical protein K1719_008058 [Acacia pycnantha]